MRWHPLAARPRWTAKPAEVSPAGELKDVDCQVRLAALNEVSGVLIDIRDRLSSLEVRTQDLRKGFAREIEASRKERRWYLEYCGGTAQQRWERTRRTG